MDYLTIWELFYILFGLHLILDYRLYMTEVYV